MQFAAVKLLYTYMAAATCSHGFFFFPSWWEFLPKADQPQLPTCDINFAFPGDVWLVGLALLDMLLRLAGFLAVVYLIVAGVQYITSGGSADRATSARKRITNALVGLLITVIATAVVSFIGKSVQ